MTVLPNLRAFSCIFSVNQPFMLDSFAFYLLLLSLASLHSSYSLLSLYPTAAGPSHLPLQVAPVSEALARSRSLGLEGGRETRKLHEV